MVQFFGFILIILVLIFQSIAEVKRYIKGNYNPYFMRPKNQSSKLEILFIVVIFAGISLISTTFYRKVAFITVFSYLILFPGVMNFMTYRNTKDKKILLQAAVFDCILVSLIIVALKNF